MPSASLGMEPEPTGYNVTPREKNCQRYKSRAVGDFIDCELAALGNWARRRDDAELGEARARCLTLFEGKMFNPKRQGLLRKCPLSYEELRASADDYIETLFDGIRDTEFQAGCPCAFGTIDVDELFAIREPAEGEIEFAESRCGIEQQSCPDEVPCFRQADCGPHERLSDFGLADWNLTTSDGPRGGRDQFGRAFLIYEEQRPDLSYCMILEGPQYLEVDRSEDGPPEVTPEECFEQSVCSESLTSPVCAARFSYIDAKQARACYAQILALPEFVRAAGE